MTVTVASTFFFPGLEAGADSTVVVLIFSVKGRITNQLIFCHLNIGHLKVP